MVITASAIGAGGPIEEGNVMAPNATTTPTTIPAATGTGPSARSARDGRWLRPVIVAVALALVALTTWTVLQTPVVPVVQTAPAVDARHPSIRQLERGMLDERGRLEQLDRREAIRLRNRVDAGTGSDAAALRQMEHGETQRLRNRVDAGTGTPGG